MSSDPPKVPSKRKGALAKWVRRLVIGSAIAYPALLVLVAVALRFLGDSWWATGVCLFLPRVLFAAPLPFLAGGLLAYRAWKLLSTQLVAALVLLFPLMGFVLPWPTRADAGEPSLRVLSYNVNSGYGGFEQIFADVDRFSPDIVFLQELFAGSGGVIDLLRARYPVVETSTQFLVASRYPIISSSDPEKLPHEGRLRSPRFMQHLIDTPLGRIAFYNVHPISPRGGFYQIRGAGLRREILSGRLLAGENAGSLESGSLLRAEQVRAFGRLADQEPYPVVIAGDTNVPGLSPLLSRYLSRYRDGFSDAGWGFGYTFPVGRGPWMRIDRILATEQLRFVGFEVGPTSVSDHRCVVADLQRRR